MNKPLFQPLSKLRSPAPTWPAWCGCLSWPGPLITDGRIVLDTRAIDPVVNETLITHLNYPDARRMGPPHTQAEVRKLFVQLGKAARKRLRVLGYVRCPFGDRLPDTVLSDKDDTPYPVDGRLLRLAMDATGADRIYGAQPDKALVLYRGRKRVACVMPLRWLRFHASAAFDAWREQQQERHG